MRMNLRRSWAMGPSLPSGGVIGLEYVCLYRGFGEELQECGGETGVVSPPSRYEHRTAFSLRPHAQSTYNSNHQCTHSLTPHLTSPYKPHPSSPPVHPPYSPPSSSPRHSPRPPPPLSPPSSPAHPNSTTPCAYAARLPTCADALRVAPCARPPAQTIPAAQHRARPGSDTAACKNSWRGGARGRRKS